ncbi:MAG: hypothetical protein ACPIOQ_49930, partial [Promethearchaeia archaeon]
MGGERSSCCTCQISQDKEERALVAPPQKAGATALRSREGRPRRAAGGQATGLVPAAAGAILRAKLKTEAMVKVHKRAVLDVVQEAPDSGAAGVPATTAGPGAGAARPSPKDHGFAVLFAACVELQDLLRCAEEERDGLRAENSALLRHVHQLQARCLELYARVRELEGAGNGDGSPPPALPHNSGTPNDDARRTSKPASAARASPLQALLRSGNVLVDSSSEGLGGGCQRVGDSFSDGHGDGDVNRDEIPMGNQIWALMDQSVRLRIEQWVVEQGRAV